MVVCQTDLDDIIMSLIVSQHISNNKKSHFHSNATCSSMWFHVISCDKPHHSMLITSIIWIIPLLSIAVCEELQGFSLNVRGLASFDKHTVTAWFNQSVYQCDITPNSTDTVFSCNASSSFIGCDTSSDIDGAKMLIENDGADAADFTATITTDLGIYTVSGICINDTANIGAYAINHAGDDHDNALCEPHWRHYTEICVDANDCLPTKQLIYFNTTAINTAVQNARWENAEELTYTVGPCVPSNETCYDLWNSFTDRQRENALSIKTDKYTLSNNETIRCGFVDLGNDTLFIGAMSEYASLTAMQTTLQSCPMYENCPYNEYDLNSGETNKLYRWSLDKMVSYRNNSISPSFDEQSYLFITCNMDLNLTEDYMLLPFNGDFVTEELIGDCYQIKQANIRGYECEDNVGNFWNKDTQHFHLDSSRCGCGGCCSWQTGSVDSEDNFGSYHITNPLFSCTKSSNSTTEYWIGSVVNHRLYFGFNRETTTKPDTTRISSGFTFSSTSIWSKQTTNMVFTGTTTTITDILSSDIWKVSSYLKEGSSLYYIMITVGITNGILIVFCLYYIVSKTRLRTSESGNATYLETIKCIIRNIGTVIGIAFEIFDMTTDYLFAASLIIHDDEWFNALGWISLIFAISGLSIFFFKYSAYRKLIAGQAEERRRKLKSKPHNYNEAEKNDLNSEISDREMDIHIISLLNGCIEDIPETLIILIVNQNIKWNYLSVLTITLSMASFTLKLSTIIAVKFRCCDEPNQPNSQCDDQQSDVQLEMDPINTRPTA